MRLPHPLDGRDLLVEAPLPAALRRFLHSAFRRRRSRTMARAFDLLVFDWDGTLLDSAGAIVTAPSMRPATTSVCRSRRTSGLDM
jgi:hypothetical protein